MKRFLQKTLTLKLTLLLVLISGAGFVYRSQDNYFEISKNIDILGKLLREVNLHYVDQVETNEFVRKGIDAMLNTLDPFTKYISSSEIEDYRFLSTGEYGGIGARITTRDGEVIVTEPYVGKPAYKAGMRAGDEIVKIDDEQVEGNDFSPDDIQNLLKGEKGKPVDVKVKRYGVDSLINIHIIRDKIKIPNVPYSGMVDEGVAYISLSQFTQDASNEVKKGLKALEDEHPDLKGIVLDLRNNPGGLLFEAINVSNLFVPEGQKIVETKGRTDGSVRVYRARNAPLDTETKIVVLINGQSASASEIVSGVVQDLDRGVIVGQRSFGKGLVQTTRPLSYNNQLKITTARYYTPSGRCIQAIDYSEDENGDNIVRTPDSLKSKFKTQSGRTVLDQGGIAPDKKVEKAKPHRLTNRLRGEGLIFEFATRFYYQHDTIAGPRAYRISSATYEDFVEFVQSQDFKYTSRLEDEFDKFHTDLKKKGYYKEIGAPVDEVEAAIESHRKNQIYEHKDEIKDFLRQEIVQRYYHRSGKIQASFESDRELKAAIELLNKPKQYEQLLNSPIVGNPKQEEAGTQN